MRDEAFHTDSDPAAWCVKPSRTLDPQSIVGWYAVDRKPLGSPQYRVIKIEQAGRCGHGHLTIYGREVEVNANGAIVSQSDYIKNIPFIPRAFLANPLSAKVRADKANEATAYFLAASQAHPLSGEMFHARANAHEARIDAILTNGGL